MITLKKGDGLRIYTWLKDHAGEYGYCQVYTEKGPHRQFGYEEEKMALVISAYSQTIDGLCRKVSVC